MIVDQLVVVVKRMIYSMVVIAPSKCQVVDLLVQPYASSLTALVLYNCTTTRGTSYTFPR